MAQAKSIIATIKRTMRSVANFSNGNRIFAEQLPLKVKMFINEYLNGKSIALIEKNKESKNNRYEVTLNDDTQLTFNENGEWTTVINKINGVATGIIPSAIFRFTYFCFPEASIVTIKRQATGYQTILSNNIVLKFNNQGQIYGLAS